MVAFHRVSYRYGADLALAEVDLVLDSGDRLALLGPNGGGKSTLVRLLLGLLRPTAGAIDRRPGLRLGYVPQFPAFDRNFPVRVEEMIAQGRLRDRRRLLRFAPVCAHDRRLVDEVVARLGLGDLRRAYLPELSGGELKRALVARALVAEPDLLVLDEPTAALDEPSRRAFWELLEALPASTAVVLATHDLAPGTFVAQRAVLVDRRLEALETNALHSHPLICGHGRG
ncbi:MAG: ATP-binding cassette domain-containing protein [Thermoanaerobaculia bacterium]